MQSNRRSVRVGVRSNRNLGGMLARGAWLLGTLALLSCGDSGGGGGAAKGTSSVVIDGTPSAVPDRWRVMVKRIGESDGGTEARTIVEHTVPVDGHTVTATGFPLTSAFLPPGDGALYVHAVALSAGAPVAVADGPAGVGGGDGTTIHGTPYKPECDLDGDTFADCTNVAGNCCKSIAPAARNELGDCVDDQSSIREPAVPDRKRRSAAAATPFAPDESADDYEVCNNTVDDDCTGGDIGCANVDGDGDGSKVDVDCDDTNPDIHPGAYDIPGDDIDQDCNNQDGSGTDADGDGFLADDPDLKLRDCNDGDTTIHPGAGEVSCDGIDQDCDGADVCLSDGEMADVDGDGSLAPEDCDDHDAAIHPGATERCGDGIDQDCSGADTPCAAGDMDKDGFVAPEDCDDANPEAHPGAPDACGDGVDENCDGVDVPCSDIQDGDGDGYGLPDDCNDRDANVHPGAPERCNNVDDNCNGEVDEGNPRLFEGNPVPHAPTCGSDVGLCELGPQVCAHRADGTVFDLCLGTLGNPEVCNGQDDDCDGLTDVLSTGEPLADEGQTVCGPAIERGACKQGRLFCMNGSLSDCRGAVQATDEICNGQDDDCDGQVDDGPGGDPIFEPCYAGPPGSDVLGVCRSGLRRCTDGQLAACEGEVTPTAEICDGLDNDCNGQVDDGIDVPCWDFDPAVRGVGACHDGHRLCVDGVLGECQGEQGPSDELCDGIDNDCDRVVDQFNRTCYDGPAGTLGEGRPCHEGIQVCVAGQFSACMGQVLPQPAELCDNQDNNCDGQIDETFDFASDPNHCGSCAGACQAGQACCSRACRGLNSLQNCGACGHACGLGADACTTLPGAAGPDCTCGNGPACTDGLRCVQGQCRCETNADCGADQLCCNGQCEATSPDTQCAACGDSGCEAGLAQTCTGRECRCGANLPCIAGATVCGQRDGVGDFRCLGCSVDSQCGATEICCGAVCLGTNPDFQCQTCGSPCDRDRADTCMSMVAGGGHTMQCSCGALGTPCDANGPEPWCINGVCEECRADADCHDGSRGQCVDHVCRACDPSDHAGCVANDLCCNFQCGHTGPGAASQCTSCGAACEITNSDSCVGRACKCGNGPPCSGDTPLCDDPRHLCVQCLVDGDCAGNPNGGQCVANVCRVCDPNGHDGCGGNEVCCSAGQPGVYRCEATGALAGDQCEACDTACNTVAGNQCVGRACGCGNNLPCSGNTPVCEDNTGTCRECVVDGDCAGRPGGGQCVNYQCRPCDPGDHAGCAADQLCCNFQCAAATAPGQCETCGTPCGADADTCHNRDCVCGAGANAVACGAGTFCVNSACRSCRNNGDCAADQLCCNNQCQGTGPGAADQCSQCGSACNQTNSSLCTARSCKCGNNPPCNGQTPVCDDAHGACVQCLGDNDCVGNANGGQCVNNLCKVCDPADHAGCAGNQLCCNNQCQATGAGVGGQCSACGAGCSQDPTNVCTGRTCLCGANQPCGGQTPFCNDANGQCVGCRSDGDCNGGQCVSNVCRTCDPADNAGCTANSNSPVCNAATFQCRGCGNDGECASNATGTYCNSVIGRCRRCNEASDQPCDLTLPICNETANACQDCANDQNCIDRPGGENECVTGDCRLCDPTGNAGCNAASNTPVCSAATFACRGCQNDGECAGNANGSQCVAGKCGQCDPAEAQCAASPATPICDPGTLTCRACGGDAECAIYPNALQCVTGRCKACDPANHDGCGEASATPICDANNATCRICQNDVDCMGRPGNRDQCVAGVCQACDTADNSGCLSTGTTPICVNNAGTMTCTGCTADAQCPAATSQCITAVGNADRGACRVCDPVDSVGCTEDSAAPICTVSNGNYACGACAGDAECVTRSGNLNLCVAGHCRGCDPTGDRGCVANSNLPKCSGVSFACVQCQNNGQCLNNPNGQQCITIVGNAARGACKPCTPTDSAGCVEDSATPICSAAFACGACGGDGECVTRAGTQNECVAGRCRTCDPTGNVGCGAATATPICDNANFGCRGCGADAECGGGTPACIAAGNCKACDPADNFGCTPTSSTPICNAATFACRACGGDPECLTSPVGDQCIPSGGSAGQCHTCDGTVAHPSCPAAQACVANECGPCAANADCNNNAAGDFCDSTNHVCVECNAAGDCAAGLICTAHACTRCAANADCTGSPDGNICDLAAGGGAVCTACAHDADCTAAGFPAGTNCVSGGAGNPKLCQ